MIECYNCKEKKLSSEYQPSRIKRAELGFQVACRKCTNQANRRWYDRNKEGRKITILAYRRKNPEKWTAYFKSYNAFNSEKIKQYSRCYHRSPDGYAQYLYKSIEMRIKHQDSYKNRQLKFTKEEFLIWLSRSTYFVFFEMWQELGYKKRFSPTIDRIDEDGDYTLDNIQVLPAIANTRKAALSDKGIIRAKKNLEKINCKKAA